MPGAQDAERIQEVSGSRGLPAIGQRRNVSETCVAGFGELWSARLLAAYLKGKLGEKTAGHWIDARELVVVREGELGPTVLWEVCRRIKTGKQLVAR